MIYQINYQTNTTTDTVLLFRRMSREDQAPSLLYYFSFIAKTKVNTFHSLEIKSIQKTLTPKSKQLYLKNESLMKYKSWWNPNWKKKWLWKITTTQVPDGSQREMGEIVWWQDFQLYKFSQWQGILCHAKI